MKTKLLLIEDNPEVLDNTAEILELADFEVLTAENGKVGVAKAKEYLPDLIICDIMMPELDGYGVLYLLGKNKETANIPFIFLTAKSEGTDFRKGMGLGADDYITKPFEEMDLLDSIESRLKKKQKLEETFSKKSPKLDSFLSDVEQVTSLEGLIQNQKKRSYKKKGSIYFDHDEPVHLYYIESGKVKTFKVNEDGKEYVTGLYNEGDFFGYMPLITDSEYVDNAEALEETELSLIPNTDFKSLLFNQKDVSNQFVKMLANDIQEKEEQLIDLAYDTVRKRVASSLIQLEDKFKKEEGAFTVAISRDDLASMVGTATESVIRMLSEFKEEKYISIAGSKITILDHSALAGLNY